MVHLMPMGSVGAYKRDGFFSRESSGAKRLLSHLALDKSDLTDQQPWAGVIRVQGICKRVETLTIATNSNRVGRFQHKCPFPLGIGLTLCVYANARCRSTL